MFHNFHLIGRAALHLDLIKKLSQNKRVVYIQNKLQYQPVTFVAYFLDTLINVTQMHLKTRNRKINMEKLHGIKSRD